MICGELLERALRATGNGAVYGALLPGVHVTEVQETGVANLLAIADARLFHRRALVHLGDGILVPPDALNGDDAIVLGSAADILAMPGEIGRGGCRALKLTLDPVAPVPDHFPSPREPPNRWLLPDEEVVARIREAQRPVILAGPGVIAHGAQASLNALAVAASAGVLNTWGAKGVFNWQSRHHLATVGLQERDFELGGLANTDLIVATGIDVDEAPEDRWQIAPVVVVDPASLGPLAERVDRPYRELEQPVLRTKLAAVTQEGWSRRSGPLAPSFVTLNYSRCLGSGGLVAADAGLAGYWVARTFATTQPGAAFVPARERAGLAIASVIVARRERPWRPALAAVDRSVEDEHSAALLEAAARLGLGVGVEVWDPDGPVIDADDHWERLGKLALTPDREVQRIRTDPSQLERMVRAAGPIIAWPGLRSRNL